MQVRPSQISPGDNFDIFYFVRNPNDSTTYYVQAVVYDVRTGAILQTVNLTQATTNSRLFIKTLQAPADPSGYGRNVVAIATVYTDAGYTTKSTDYEEQEQYFLVRAVMPDLVGGGGGVDYRHVREMMQAELKPVLDKLNEPEPEEQAETDSLQSLYGAIGALQREVNRIPKELDLSGITDGLAAIKATLDGIQSAMAILAQPDPEPDFSPIMAGLQTLSDGLAALDQRVLSIGAAQASTLVGELRGAMDGLKKTVTDAIQSHEITIPLKGMNPQPQQPTPSPVDVSHLMS